MRKKLPLLLSVFLLIIAILAAGTLLIFDVLNKNMSSLATVSEETKMLNELDRSIADFVEVVREWGFTGDIKYKKLYGKKLAQVYKSFGTLGVRSLHQDVLQVISRKFQTILDASRNILSRSDLIGTPEMLEQIKNIEAVALDIILQIDEAQEYSLTAVTNAAQSAEKTKKRMITYHVSLIIFTSLISLLLFISIRRTISDPFNELLKATEKIGKGDLSYRIRMDRTDEFGVVARRFDNMVAALESSSVKVKSKLDQTELLLDIARVAGTTLELKDVFQYIVETLAERMHFGRCSETTLK